MNSQRIEAGQHEALYFGAPDSAVNILIGQSFACRHDNSDPTGN